MNPPGKPGQPIDAALYKELKRFCRSIVRKMGVYDEDQIEIVQDTLADLGVAIALNSLASHEPAVLASWVMTCATRKVLRWRELQQRVGPELKEEDAPLTSDGMAVVLAREMIRRISTDAIEQIVDYKLDPTKSKQERRKAKYVHEKVVKKFKPGPKKPKPKKLSRSHWRYKLEKLNKTKPK